MQDRMAINDDRKVKVKVHTPDIAPLLVKHHRRSAHVWHVAIKLKLSRTMGHTFIRNRNEPYLPCLPSYSWYSFTDPGGMEG